MLRSDARYEDVAFGWRFVDIVVAARRRFRLHRLSSAVPYLFMLPALVLVAVLAVGLVGLLWRSVHSFDPFLRVQGDLSAEQYARLLTGPDASYYREILGRTVLVSAFVTAGSVAIGLVVSYFLVRTRRSSSRLVALTIILVPFLMGEIVRAFGWLLLLGRRGALAWLTSPMTGEGGGLSLVGTRVGIWVAMMQTMIPVAVLVMLPTVRQIDPDLERAATTLGGRPRHVWARVILPLSRPGLAAASVVVFSLSMTEFAMPQALGLGRQPFVANTIHGIYFLQNNVYFGSALAVILVLVVALGVAAIGAVGRGRVGR